MISTFNKNTKQHKIYICLLVGEIDTERNVDFSVPSDATRNAHAFMSFVWSS